MNIDKIMALNLWPKAKKTTKEKGVQELEDKGYNLFYIGKNADLYTCPGEDAKVLLLRSDRCSVFDIPLNLEIEGKGILQTAISNNGADFAKNKGVRTAILDEKIDESLNVAPRCQLMELCKPLEAQIDGELTQFEFIFRNYLTGSLFEACKNGSDPYGLNLPSNLEEWSRFETPLFTPTTKGIKDIPLNSQQIRNTFPEIIKTMENLFKDFTDFAYENGIVVVDTKFEIFINSKDEWVLGDEVLTPESSRFIEKDNFEKGSYISMDKQILRNFALSENWKQRAKDELKTGEKLDVVVPQNIKDEILHGYKTIYNRLNSLNN